MIHKKNNTNIKLFFWKYKFTVVALLLSIFTSLVFIFLMQEPKPDPASEKIIRNWAAAKFDKDPNELTDEDYESFTSFLLFVIELSDIRLLEKFTNLQQLGLADIRFPKKEIPKWMEILSKLGIYDLNKRFTIDLSPLEKLHNLKQLTIQNTPISNLKPIKGLNNLEVIYLVNISISNLEPLKGIKNLKELHIQDCENVTDKQIADLQKALPNLEIKR